jgi:DNA-binding response OmpR family regulator
MKDGVRGSSPKTSRSSRLVENPNRLITRDELLRAVWPDAAVSPSVVRVS